MVAAKRCCVVCEGALPEREASVGGVPWTTELWVEHRVGSGVPKRMAYAGRALLIVIVAGACSLAKGQFCVTDPEHRNRTSGKWSVGCSSTATTVIRGLHDDDDNFTDIDAVKCCRGPVKLSVAAAQPSAVTVNLVAGGTYRPQDQWLAQCPSGYAVTSFLNSHCQTCSFLDVSCVQLLGPRHGVAPINETACSTVRTVHGGTYDATGLWKTECSIASVITAIWTSILHWKYNRPLRYIKCCPLTDPCSAYGLNCTRGFGQCQPNPAASPGSPTAQQYHCACRSGFEGPECTRDVDECTASHPACSTSPGVRCHNTFGSYLCSCAEGYRANFSTSPTVLTCEDTDECQRPEGMTQCNSATGPCQNTIGSFYCNCRSGFYRQSNGSCANRDECTEQPGLCSPFGKCTDTIGSYHCQCRRGLKAADNRTWCKDIDECSGAPALCAHGACSNTYGSYWCVCDAGYRSGNGSCTLVDGCRTLENPCGPLGVCMTNGSGYYCLCDAGSVFANGTCVHLDVCRNSRSCGVHGTCVSQATYQCRCVSGYEFLNGTCLPTDPCKTATLNGACGKYGQCYSSESGLSQCRCSRGYEFTTINQSCVPVNPCAIPVGYVDSVCGPNGTCVTANNSSYTCVCDPGYSFRSHGCVDDDECRLRSDFCGPPEFGRCVNLPGSAMCVCNPGYYLHGTSGKCQDSNECTDPVHRQACQGGCRNYPGKYGCQCPSGFFSTNRNLSCADWNECSSGPCGNHSVCINTFGSFRCLCQQGYDSINGTCVMNDPCTMASNKNTCGRNGRCQSTVAGLVQCLCDQGYAFDIGNQTCTAADPCTLPGGSECGACGPNGSCIGQNTSYTCRCDPGFSLNRASCVDDNECGIQADYCGPPQAGRCINVPGSAICVCNSGYGLNATSGMCVDRDECRDLAVVQICQGKCRNTPGRYECDCPAGFSTGGTNQSCLDLNECQSNPCGRHSICVNSLGSYTCVCGEGSSHKNGTCTRNAVCRSDTCGSNSVCLEPHLNSSLVRCSCQQGYRWNNNSCTAVDPCMEIVCPENSACSVTSRNAAFCTCHSAYRFVNGTCSLDTKPSCTQATCPENSACYIAADGMDIDCICDAGFRNVSNSCVAMGTCQSDSCGNYSTCHPMPGKAGVQCVCNHGYQFQNGSCHPSDPCLGSECGEHSSCIVLSNHTTLCRCAQGFASLNNTCKPLHICRSDSCGPNSACHDGVPSHPPLCSCSAGFEWTNSACRRKPGCQGQPCGPNSACSEIGPERSILCVCLPGFKLSNSSCVPADLCSDTSNRCGDNSVCISDANGFGFECRCRDEFLRQNGSCQRVDPCEEPSCGANAVCESTSGSRAARCICTGGYHWVNASCRDRNECAEFPAACGVGGVCVNTPGSFRCVCRDGYESLSSVTSLNYSVCNDLNECLHQGVCGPGATCVNTASSYSCLCSEGYELRAVVQQDGRRTLQLCRDVNECENSDGSCHPGVCVNSAGSYACQCPSGYATSANGTACEDVDECQAVNRLCGMGGECVNLPASYTCRCSQGFETNPEYDHAVDSYANSIPRVLSSAVSQPAVGTQSTPGGGPTEPPTNASTAQLSVLPCHNVDECSRGVHGCWMTAVCVDTPGSYLCICPDYSVQSADGIGRACSDGATSTDALAAPSASNRILVTSVVVLAVLLFLLALALVVRAGRRRHRKLASNRLEWHNNTSVQLTSAASHQLNNTSTSTTSTTDFVVSHSSGLHLDWDTSASALPPVLALSGGKQSSAMQLSYADVDPRYGCENSRVQQPILAVSNPGFGLALDDTEFMTMIDDLPEASVDDDDDDDDCQARASIILGPAAPAPARKTQHLHCSTASQQVRDDHSSDIGPRTRPRSSVTGAAAAGCSRFESDVTMDTCFPLHPRRSRGLDGELTTAPRHSCNGECQEAPVGPDKLFSPDEHSAQRKTTDLFVDLAQASGGEQQQQLCQQHRCPWAGNLLPESTTRAVAGLHSTNVCPPSPLLDHRNLQDTRSRPGQSTRDSSRSGSMESVKPEVYVSVHSLPDCASSSFTDTDGLLQAIETHHSSNLYVGSDTLPRTEI